MQHYSVICITTLSVQQLTISKKKKNIGPFIPYLFHNLKSAPPLLQTMHHKLFALTMGVTSISKSTSYKKMMK